MLLLPQALQVCKSSLLDYSSLIILYVDDSVGLSFQVAFHTSMMPQGTCTVHKQSQFK